MKYAEDLPGNEKGAAEKGSSCTSGCGGSPGCIIFSLDKPVPLVLPITHNQPLICIDSGHSYIFLATKTPDALFCLAHYFVSGIIHKLCYPCFQDF